MSRREIIGLIVAVALFVGVYGGTVLAFSYGKATTVNNKTNYPNGNGVTTDWGKSHADSAFWQCVNQTTANDNDWWALPFTAAAKDTDYAGANGSTLNWSKSPTDSAYYQCVQEVLPKQNASDFWYWRASGTAFVDTAYPDAEGDLLNWTDGNAGTGGNCVVSADSAHYQCVNEVSPNTANSWCRTAGGSVECYADLNPDTLFSGTLDSVRIRISTTHSAAGAKNIIVRWDTSGTDATIDTVASGVSGTYSVESTRPITGLTRLNLVTMEIGVKQLDAPSLSAIRVNWIVLEMFSTPSGNSAGAECYADFGADTTYNLNYGRTLDSVRFTVRGTHTGSAYKRVIVKLDTNGTTWNLDTVDFRGSNDTIYVDGDGDLVEWAEISQFDWQDVDERVADESDYVTTSGLNGLKTEMFDLENDTGYAPSLDSVRILLRGRHTQAGGTVRLELLVDTAGTNVPFDTVFLTTSAANYISGPLIGITKTQLANIEIGFRDLADDTAYRVHTIRLERFFSNNIYHTEYTRAVTGLTKANLAVLQIGVKHLDDPTAGESLKVSWLPMEKFLSNSDSLRVCMVDTDIDTSGWWSSDSVRVRIRATHTGSGTRRLTIFYDTVGSVAAQKPWDTITVSGSRSWTTFTSTKRTGWTKAHLHNLEVGVKGLNAAASGDTILVSWTPVTHHRLDTFYTGDVRIFHYTGDLAIGQLGSTEAGDDIWDSSLVTIGHGGLTGGDNRALIIIRNVDSITGVYGAATIWQVDSAFLYMMTDTVVGNPSVLTARFVLQGEDDIAAHWSAIRDDSLCHSDWDSRRASAESAVQYCNDTTQWGLFGMDSCGLDYTTAPFSPDTIRPVNSTTSRISIKEWIAYLANQTKTDREQYKAIYLSALAAEDSLGSHYAVIGNIQPFAGTDSTWIVVYGHSIPTPNKEVSGVGEIFGDTLVETGTSSIENNIVGGVFTMPAGGGIGLHVTAYIDFTGSAHTANFKCKLYTEASNPTALANAETQERALLSSGGDGWYSFNFTANTFPVLVAGTQYVLAVWGSGSLGSHSARLATTGGEGSDKQAIVYDPIWPNPMVDTKDSPLHDDKVSIYCTYTTIFGRNTAGPFATTLENKIVGGLYPATATGTLDSILTDFQFFNGAGTFTIKCALYDFETLALVVNGQTEERTFDAAVAATGWYKFDFPDPRPSVTIGKRYLIPVWSNLISGLTDAAVYYNSTVQGAASRTASLTYGSWPDPLIADGSPTNQWTSVYAVYAAAPPAPSVANPRNRLRNGKGIRPEKRPFVRPKYGMKWPVKLDSLFVPFVMEEEENR